MTRLLRTAALTAILAILALVPTAALGAEGFEATTEAMYTFNHNGTDCAAKDGRLVYEPNPAGAGCGYIFGAPIGEVEHQTNSGVFPNVRTYTTVAGFAPVTLDASRTVTGVVTITSRQSVCASTLPCVAHTGVGSGVGQVVVDLQFTGVAANAPSNSPKVLGTARVQALVLPGQVEVQIPYEITLPASADQAAFRGLSLSTDVHGGHVNTGYAVTDGRTTVDVPSLTPIAEDAAS